MTTNKHSTKLEFVSQCKTLATGVLALPDATIVVSEQTLTKAEAAAPLQAYVAAVAQTALDKTAYEKSMQAEKVAEAAAHLMVGELKPVLQGRLGKSNPALETQYGIPPVKKAQKTVAAKAAGIAKSQATRSANHTMGPKQKKASKAAGNPAPASPVTPAAK